MSFKLFLLFLLVVSCIGVNAQSKYRSQIYSSNGELIVNPKYSIDSTRVKDVALFEYYTLSGVYKEVKYPIMGLIDGISGMVIAKIRADSTGIEIKIVESDHYPPDAPAQYRNLFNVPVENGINASKENILRFIKDFEIKLPFEFYIPFQFIFEDTFREGLKNNKAVVIKERAPVTDGYFKLK